MNVIAIVLIAFFLSACTKDVNENVKLDKDNSSIRVQKWNPDDDSPFILTENPPFQYAIYQEDEGNLFEYIRFVLEEQGESENPGYFILTYKKEFIYYGFLTETNSYYHLYIPNNPDIPPVDPGDGIGDGNLCFGMVYKYFNNKQEAKDFTKEKAKECECKISIIKRKGQWIVGWDDGR